MIYAEQMDLARLDERYQRYLRVLGVDHVPAGLEGLRALVRLHLYRVPFENLSKLLLFGREKAGRFLTLDEFLDGLERQDFGGTCHSNNPFLGELLRALGYDARLLGADMGPRLNVHTCLRVHLEGVAYHVDVGYGGPFREPVRLDRLPLEIVEGAERYAFSSRTDAPGYEMVAYAGDERVHGYSVNEQERTREFFTPPMLISFQPDAAFLNCVRICRFFDSYSVTLLDRQLKIHRDGRTTVTELKSAAEWADALKEAVRMPRAPWRQALAVMEQVTGRPFFESQAASADS